MKRPDRLPAADARLVKLEASYRKVTAQVAKLRPELARLSRLTGADRDVPRAFGYAASGAAEERDRLRGVAAERGGSKTAEGRRLLTMSASFDKAARHVAGIGRKARAELKARKRKVGLTALEQREHGLVIALGQLHDKIMTAKPAGLAGVAVQLRHLLDPDLGIASGVCTYDVPALRRVLVLVERQAPAVRGMAGKPRRLATESDVI